MRAWFVQRVKCAPTKDRSMELLAILAPQLAVHTSTSSYWIEQTKIKSFIEKLLGNFLPMIACENCKQFLLTTITAPNSARWCEAGWKLLQMYLLEPCVVSPPHPLDWVGKPSATQSWCNKSYPSTPPLNIFIISAFEMVFIKKRK